MTQTPSDNDRASQPPASGPGRSRVDRRAKVVFLLILVALSAFLWLRQRRDPPLPGWGNDLAVALQQAQADRRPILVFFTRSPMSYDDKHVVTHTIRTQRTLEAIGKLRYAKVHLNTRQNKNEAQTYHVTSTPTYLLLDPNGKELRRTSGLMNDMKFAEFLAGTGS